jgi:hypothetical protein
VSDERVQVIFALATVAVMAILAVTAWQAMRRFRDTTLSGPRVIVRCREGHLFMTVWVPGISVKAIRLGMVRFQYCPVGDHRTFVVPVSPASLTDLQRRQAQFFDDGGVP